MQYFKVILRVKSVKYTTIPPLLHDILWIFISLNFIELKYYNKLLECSIPIICR